MEKESTGSIAQDALLEGYLYTCHTGVSKLLGIDELTKLSCQNYIPKALEESQEKKADCDIILDEFKRVEKELSEILKKLTPVNRFLYSLSKETRLDLERAKEDLHFYKQYKDKLENIDHYFLGEPEIDDIRGRVNVSLFCMRKNGQMAYIDQYYYGVKSAQVKYEDFDTYTETLLPDHVLSEIKRAKEIGIKDIKIAYPIYVKATDPLVIGYIPYKDGERTLHKMFLITRFGVNKEEDKQLAACNVKSC